MMWPVWFVQLLHFQFKSELGNLLPYSPLKYKEAMLFLSWGRIPLIWVSWIAFKQIYEFTFMTDLVLFSVLIVLAYIGGWLTELEDNTYGMYDYYCN